MKFLILLLTVFVTSLATRANEKSSQSSAQVNEKARHEVTSAANAFALDLYKAARSKPGNVVISPFSVAALLSWMWHGAGGRTAQQLASALHLPREHVAAGYRSLLNSLLTNDEVVLRIANKLYVQKGFQVKDYFRRIALDFGADVDTLDFAHDADKSRLAINQWAERHTEGKIKDLLGKGFPSADTLLLLVNAIYLKAGWWNPFEERYTRLERFHLSQHAEVKVPTMKNLGEFKYGSLPEFNSTVLILEYLRTASSLTMMIILPNSICGLERLEAGIDHINLKNIILERRYMRVMLPKFRIEVTHELNEHLKKIGLEDLFVPAANLSGISDQRLHVNKAVQKTFIEVNEKGTEAGAVTGFDYVFFSLPPTPTDFIADHPFMFLIMEGDLILFAGRVTDPRN